MMAIAPTARAAPPWWFFTITPRSHRWSAGLSPDDGDVTISAMPGVHLERLTGENPGEWAERPRLRPPGRPAFPACVGSENPCEREETGPRIRPKCPSRPRAVLSHSIHGRDPLTQGRR